MPSELVSPFETKFYIILHFQTFPSLCLKRLNVSLPFFFSVLHSCVAVGLHIQQEIPLVCK